MTKTKESTTKTTSLTREALLGAIKAQKKIVSVEGIGDVMIRSWSPVSRSRRQAAIASMKKEDQFAHANAYAVIDMVCDVNGEQLFSEQDLAMLLSDDVSSSKLDRLYDACSEFDEDVSGNE